MFGIILLRIQEVMMDNIILNDKYEIENMIHSKARIGKSDSLFGRFLNYFFDN